ncbi:MAG: SMC-Scp complex subunit ScpB [Candidatus Thermoplasmatota archaeon]|nr:SMC-Scp complex subunit ScpB [Candidatus Thermoplasmatota archaeon]
MNLGSKIEAILYASKDPISVSSVADLLGEEKDSVAKELRKLKKSYESRDSALTITRTGKGYKLELRKNFIDLVIPVSDPEFTPSEIDVITFIASRGSCMKTDLRRRFGARFVEPLEKFRREKLVNMRKERNAEIYSVTKHFFTYFQVSPDEVKQALTKQGEDAE